MVFSKKLLVLLSVIILLSGCTVRVAYNYMDWYLAWKVDDFVELNDEQEILFEKAIDDFKTWHKNTELPKYQALLTKLESAVKNKNATELSGIMQSSSEIWKTSAEHIAPSLIMLINSLSPEQKQELISNIAKQQQEAHEQWLEDAKLTQEQQINLSIENMEERLGSLSDEQKVRFRENWLNMGSTMELRIESRLLWLDNFKQAVLHHDNIDQVALFNLFTDINSYRSEEHIALSESNKLKYRAFITQELANLTDAQQQKVLATIREYIADVTYLINS